MRELERRLGLIAASDASPQGPTIYAFAQSAKDVAARALECKPAGVRVGVLTWAD